MEAKLTRLTDNISLQLHLLAESCTICGSRSRRPVRKLLDTPSCVMQSYNSRDTSVGIVTCYGLDDQGSRVRFPAGVGNFYLRHRVRTATGPTQSPMKWVPAALSLRIKRSGCEADHSRPASAEVKNAWSYSSTPTICLHGVMLS
jgi:hypothetical protein